MSDRDLTKVPAARLAGLKLSDGWVVTAALPKKSSSGGTFSCKIACNIDPLRGFFASNSDPSDVMCLRT